MNMNVVRFPLLVASTICMGEFHTTTTFTLLSFDYFSPH